MAGFYISTYRQSDSVFHAKSTYLMNRGTDLTILAISDETPINISYTHSNGSAYYTDSKDTITGDYNIYNISELNQFIPTDFQAQSTSETLLKLYHTFGANMVSKLNGSFAFIIYDKEQNIIFGARDRLGEKPCFYAVCSNGIECASSLKSICHAETHSINENARNMYIRYGFIYDSECIFNNVHKLPAGHYFIYNLNSNQLSISKYWDICDYNIQESSRKIDIHDTLEHIDYLLSNSIALRSQNISNIGVGISSGTDGLTIYGYLHDLRINVTLFNIIPSLRSRYNEYPDALKHTRQIDNDVSINHHIINDDDLLSGLNSTIMCYDEPNSDLSTFITDTLFREMYQNHILTALSGIGSDDIFFAKPLYSRYFSCIPKYQLTYIDCIDWFPNIQVNDPYSNILTNGNLISLQLYNIKTYLPNLLIKEDIASMHNRVDVYNPFCDHRLVEYLNTLPINILYHDNVFKYLLKSLLLNKYGVDFFKSAKKGFFPDVSKIYRNSILTSDIYNTLTTDNVIRFFPDIDVQKLQQYLSNKKVAYSNRSLLNLYIYIKIMMNYYSKIMH